MWFCRQVPQPDRPPSLSSLSRTETLSSSPSPHAHTSLGLAPAPIHAASQCSLLFLRGGPCPPLSSVPFAPPRGSRSQGARARRRRIGRQRRRWIWEWWSRRRLHSPGTGQIRPTSFTGATPSTTSHGDILEAVVITDRATGRSKGYGFVSMLPSSSSISSFLLCVLPGWGSWGGFDFQARVL